MNYCSDCETPLLSPPEAVRGVCDECWAEVSVPCINCGQRVFRVIPEEFDDEVECDECWAAKLLTPESTRSTCWICGSNLQKPTEQLRGDCETCFDRDGYGDLLEERQAAEARRRLDALRAAQYEESKSRKKKDRVWELVGWLVSLALMVAFVGWYFVIPYETDRRNAPTPEPTWTLQEERTMLAQLNAGLLSGTADLRKLNRAIDIACRDAEDVDAKRACYRRYGRPENYDEIRTADYESWSVDDMAEAQCRPIIC